MMTEMKSSTPTTAQATAVTGEGSHCLADYDPVQTTAVTANQAEYTAALAASAQCGGT
jgi:hypothetical protein